jgi:tetratricopeptide (TPR) repeat protein
VAQQKPVYEEREEDASAPVEDRPLLLSDEIGPKMERILADLEALLHGREFQSVDDASAFLTRLLSDDDPVLDIPDTPLRRAQDLMYEAWDADEKSERVKLAREAIEMSPDCADAYVVLAEETAETLEEAADLYTRGVAAGARALGTAFDQYVGCFWLTPSTRPYMRARFGLARTLWDVGRAPEAIAHAWDLLRLNPSDDQNVRHLLLDWLLETDEAVKIERLVERYEEDPSAEWLYGRALYAFRREGDTRRSRAFLRQARSTNRHVIPYLTGRWRLPRRLPRTMAYEDEREAVVCAAHHIGAWEKTPGALDWLRANRK